MHKFFKKQIFYPSRFAERRVCFPKPTKTQHTGTSSIRKALNQNTCNKSKTLMQAQKNISEGYQSIHPSNACVPEHTCNGYTALAVISTTTTPFVRLPFAQIWDNHTGKHNNGHEGSVGSASTTGLDWSFFS